MNKHKIIEFDLSKMKSDKVVLITGNSQTGKTTLAKDIINHDNFNGIPIKIAMTNQPYQYESCSIQNIECIESILQKQKIRKRAYVEVRRGGDKELCKKLDPRLLLVNDDSTIHPRFWIHNRFHKFIHFNGRCYNISYLVVMNDSTKLYPSLRANTDYIFLGGETDPQIRRKIYDQWARTIPYQLFEELFEECTKDYGFLVISQLSKSDKLEDHIFWYKVNILKHHPNLSEEMKEEIVQLANHFKFKPGGSGYLFAQSSFQMSRNTI